MEENHFSHRISKEDINKLPIVHFPGTICEVNNYSQVLEAVSYLQEVRCVGVDTETRPSFVRHFENEVAILQISTDAICYIFRLSQIGLPAPLVKIFTDARICKVGLAFRDDLRKLEHYFKFVPTNCVDLQKIVPTYGILDLSLVAIFAICFGKRISKRQRLSNWENAQLSLEQKLYAATDAWATLQIYKKLSATAPLSPEELRKIKEADVKAPLG